MCETLDRVQTNDRVCDARRESDCNAFLPPLPANHASLLFLFLQRNNRAIASSYPIPTTILNKHCCRFFVGLNPESDAPYIDHLEKGYNLEIKDRAKAEVEACRQYLTETYFQGSIDYEFVEIEG